MALHAGVLVLSPGDELRLTLRKDPSIAVSITAEVVNDSCPSRPSSPSPPLPVAVPGSTSRAGLFTVSATVMRSADRVWLRLGPDPEAALADFRVLRVRRDYLVSVPALLGTRDASSEAETKGEASASAVEASNSSGGGVVAPVLSVTLLRGKGLWPAPAPRRAASAAKAAAAAAAAAEAFCRVSIVGTASRYTRSARAGATGDPVWGDAFRFALRTAVADPESGGNGRREIAEDQVRDKIRLRQNSSKFVYVRVLEFMFGAGADCSCLSNSSSSACTCS